MMIRIEWQFSNGHQWFKEFETIEQADTWVSMSGLDTHPSVTHLSVTTIESDTFWPTQTLRGDLA